jgi:hypothetical protein
MIWHQIYILGFIFGSMVANAPPSERAMMRLSVRVLGVETRQVLTTISLSQIDIHIGSGIPSLKGAVALFFKALCSLGVGRVIIS